jgi:hypothetical protein
MDVSWGPNAAVVRVEPPADDPGGVRPFVAVLRRTSDGRTTLSSTEGRTLPSLVQGQRLLLVPEHTTTRAPLVLVQGTFEGAPDTIVVSPASDNETRARRASPRVAAPLDVDVVVDGTTSRGWLQDVSRTGAGVLHHGEPVADGTLLRLVVGVGGFAGNGQKRSLDAEVVWSAHSRDDLATTGLRFTAGQSTAISQVLLEARRASRRARPTNLTG